MKKPDWRNDEDYACFDKKFPDEGWAWEFIRRNPAYAKDWASFNEEAEKYRKRFGPEWKLHESTMMFSPPLRPGETPQQWERRCLRNEADFEKMPLERSYARKWGLGRRMQNPELPYTKIKSEIRFSDPLPFPKIVDAPQELKPYLEDPENPFNVVRPRYVVLAFDLEDSLEDQLNKSEKILRKRKKRVKTKRSRRDRSAWPLYLRILDARNGPGKVPFADIGIALKIASEDEYPDRKATNRTRDYHKRAIDVMSDHMKILLPDKRRKGKK